MQNFKYKTTHTALPCKKLISHNGHESLCLTLKQFLTLSKNDEKIYSMNIKTTSQSTLIKGRKIVTCSINKYAMFSFSKLNAECRRVLLYHWIFYLYIMLLC